MRSTFTLSLPPDLLASFRSKAKKAKMSLSGYIRRILVNQEHLITEEEILESSREAQEDYKNGLCAVLRTEEDIDRTLTRETHIP